MEISLIKSLLDACYLGKRVRDLLPALPSGVSSSYIQYLDAIEKMQSGGRQVRVSDVSTALKLPRPGVTRTLRDMEEAGYLQKNTSETDGRITYLTITPAGQELSEAYNARFFRQLAPMLSAIPDEDAQCTVRTIEKLYKIMSEARFYIGY